MNARAALAGLLFAASCTPAFEERPWAVEAPAILAMHAEPAEAKPGAEIRLHALLASPEGPRSSEPLSWAFCLTPRTLDERNGVSAACLATEGEQLRPTEPDAATVPIETCSRFGPNPPPSEPGEPPLRAADADSTGGYYQPVRARLDDPPLVAFGLARVSCGLPGAPAELVGEFVRTYAANRNPAIEALVAVEADQSETSSTSLAQEPLERGRSIRLRLRWAASEAETYPVYDPALVRLSPRTESMRVSWFATRGNFATDRTGRSESETSAGAIDTENVWTAPEESGPVWIWVVLRDSRGGASWLELPLQVQ